MIFLFVALLEVLPFNGLCGTTLRSHSSSSCVTNALNFFFALVDAVFFFCISSACLISTEEFRGVQKTPASTKTRGKNPCIY